VSSLYMYRGRRGRDRMVVGYITTYAISGYHHLRCEFQSHSGEMYSIQHYAIKFVIDLRQFGFFSPGTPISITHIYTTAHSSGLVGK
jgi:hypothetical protein